MYPGLLFERSKFIPNSNNFPIFFQSGVFQRLKHFTGLMVLWVKGQVIDIVDLVETSNGFNALVFELSFPFSVYFCRINPNKQPI
jgi:hypothetical protein